MDLKQRVIHRILTGLFLVLAFTGLLLGLPGLRGNISGVRYVLVNIHMLAGVFFVIAFAANLPFFQLYRLGLLDGLHRREYLWSLGLVSLGWALSGLSLLAVLLLGYEGPTANIIYDGHILLATIGATVVMPHFVFGMVQIWRRAVPVSTRSEAASGEGRRDFFRYVIGGLLFLGIVSGSKWLAQWLSESKGEKMEAFAQCNKMIPHPTPSPESLPPKGGGYSGKFRVYKVAPIPCATTEDWKFSVSGQVEKPQVLTWADFLKLPRVVQVSDFHCVEGWSVLGVTYEGVRLSALLDRVGVKPQGRFVKFLSLDGVYTDALSIEQARLDDMMAAVMIDGKEIPSDLGGPVRLVAPQMFAYKAVKWLGGIELVDVPYKGYWEVRGYSVDAWVKPPRG